MRLGEADSSNTTKSLSSIQKKSLKEIRLMLYAFDENTAPSTGHSVAEVGASGIVLIHSISSGPSWYKEFQLPLRSANTISARAAICSGFIHRKSLPIVATPSISPPDQGGFQIQRRTKDASGNAPINNTPTKL